MGFWSGEEVFNGASVVARSPSELTIASSENRDALVVVRGRPVCPLVVLSDGVSARRGGRRRSFAALGVGPLGLV